MNRSDSLPTESWPRWFRFTAIAVATIFLCSCRGPAYQAMTGNPGPLEIEDPLLISGSEETAYPVQVGGPQVPWRPPGLAGPWPPDEYLCDGGDANGRAVVDPDWNVRGVNLEDTIAHFDTLDGQTIVEPSNRVCIYSPRFGAVRRVQGLEVQQIDNRVTGIRTTQSPNRQDLVDFATSSLQRLQPLGERGTRAGSTYRARQQSGSVDEGVRLAAVFDGLMPHENLSIIRQGHFDRNEKVRLAKVVQAAISWSLDETVQVIIDGQNAAIIKRDAQAEVIFGLDEPKHPRLRIVKIASTHSARPGETVDFTIRYDNLGDQTIGNVTVIDNLATRLEYVPDSAQSSRPAELIVQTNQGESLRLRWEIRDPLKTGEGGIIRFRCIVR